MCNKALGRLANPPPLVEIVVAVKILVIREWPRIQIVADALVRRGRLDYGEFVGLFSRAVLSSPPCLLVRSAAERGAGPRSVAAASNSKRVPPGDRTEDLRQLEATVR